MNRETTGFEKKKDECHFHGRTHGLNGGDDSLGWRNSDLPSLIERIKASAKTAA